MQLRKIKGFIEKIPKVEIHIHLEGCIDSIVLQKLSPHKKIKIPRNFRNLTDFVRKYIKLCDCIKNGEDIFTLTMYVLQKLNNQRTIYCELTFNPPTFFKKGICQEEICEAIVSAKKEAEKKLKIKANFILDVTRKFAKEYGVEMVKKAYRYFKDGIIGIGLGGDETLFPTRQSKNVFSLARKYGFWTTAHCGESAGPESIWEAVNLLKVNRLEHCLTMIHDEKLMNQILKRRIPITNCLTSNKILGFIKNISEHPFKDYYERKFLVSLNTDDPGLFNTNMEKEFLIAVKNFNLDEKDILKLTMNAIDSTFLSEDEKKALKRIVQ